MMIGRQKFLWKKVQKTSGKNSELLIFGGCKFPPEVNGGKKFNGLHRDWDASTEHNRFHPFEAFATGHSHATRPVGLFFDGKKYGKAHLKDLKGMAKKKICKFIGGVFHISIVLPDVVHQQWVLPSTGRASQSTGKPCRKKKSHQPWKKTLTFHYPDCLIRILIVVYYNPHITG